MRTRASSASVLSLVALGILAGACSDSGDPNTPPPTTPPTTLKIGAVLSLSGSAEALGLEAKRGIEVAVAQLNALGGIRGKKIELVVENDASDPNLTVAAVNKLKEQGITLGIGPTTTPAALQMKDLILQEQVLYVSPSATSVALDEIGGQPVVATGPDQPPPVPVFFRTAATDVFLSAAISQYAGVAPEAGAEVRCSSVALLSQNDEYGKNIKDGIVQRYQSVYGYTVALETELDPNADAALLESAAAAVVAEAEKTTNRLPCQIVVAQPRLAGDYMRAFRAAADGKTLGNFITIGADGFRQNEFIIAGRGNAALEDSPTAGEGCIAIAANTAPEEPTFSAFRNLFKARFPVDEPGRYGSTAYDAAMLLALAIERAGAPGEVLPDSQTVTLKSVRDEVWRVSRGSEKVSPDKASEMLAKVRAGASVNYEGASGSVNFEIDGHVKSAFGVWRIQNASFVLEDRFNVPELEGN